MRSKRTRTSVVRNFPRRPLMAPCASQPCCNGVRHVPPAPRGSYSWRETRTSLCLESPTLPRVSAYIPSQNSEVLVLSLHCAGKTSPSCYAFLPACDAMAETGEERGKNKTQSDKAEAATQLWPVICEIFYLSLPGCLLCVWDRCASQAERAAARCGVFTRLLTVLIHRRDPLSRPRPNPDPKRLLVFGVFFCLMYLVWERERVDRMTEGEKESGRQTERKNGGSSFSRQSVWISLRSKPETLKE